MCDESLSGRKSSTKAAKPREKSKKDSYLFKRRDEPGDTGTSQTGAANPTSLSSSPLEDRQSNPEVEELSLQKRDEPLIGRDQVDVTASARDDEQASSHSLSKPVSGPVKESGHAPILKRMKVDLLKKSPRKTPASSKTLLNVWNCGKGASRVRCGSQLRLKIPRLRDLAEGSL